MQLRIRNECASRSVVSRVGTKEGIVVDTIVRTTDTPKPAGAFTSPISHPAYLTLGLTAYSLIAVDVFSPDSLHLLQPLDQALHQTTLATIDPVVRKQLFGGLLSNAWTIAAGVGWIFTTATALSRNNPLAWKACALAWGLWIFGVGPIEHDPALMDVLKTSFGRVRPSPIHRTASFPSGHTASDVLCVGALLFVLLPVVFGDGRALQRRGGEGEGRNAGGAKDDGRGTEGGQGGHFGDGVKRLFGAVYDAQHSWALWGLSAATTIVGRVGVDAHWLSDTLAGAALSLALVSGLASATERLAARTTGVEDAAGPAAATPAAAGESDVREYADGQLPGAAAEVKEVEVVIVGQSEGL